MSSGKKLTVDDVFCVACRCIYIRPVTMPCNHTLCLECFKNMVNLTAYQCPMCRKRISNWLRKYKNDWDSLVNEKLWEEVQRQFPLEVQKRLNDEDDGLEEIIAGQSFVRVENKKGEVKKEFETMIIELRKEEIEMEMANLEFAKIYQEVEIETARVIQEKMREDAILAAMIQKDLERELQEEQILFNESDECLARKLQNQGERELQEEDTSSNKSDEDIAEQLPYKMELELQQEDTFSNESNDPLARRPQDQMKSEVKKANTGVKNKKRLDSKREQSKKLPALGTFIERYFRVKEPPEVQHNDTENGYSPRSPTTSEYHYSPRSPTISENHYSQLPNTSSSFSSRSTPSSSNESFNSIVTESSDTSGGYNIFDKCTCGRLEGDFCKGFMCQFCIEQIALFEKLTTQQKTDYLMAKELEESFRKENFEDYNLRKRMIATQSSGGRRKKVVKLSKGQQTIKQVLRVDNN